MRNREQFKAYVYEKAATARVKNKKMRAVALRGVAAFSLFVVIDGVVLYSNLTNNAAMSAETVSAEGNCNVRMYSASEESVLEAVLDAAEADKDGDVATITAKDTISSCTFHIAASADAYQGELENIDFEKNVALVLEECVKNSNYIKISEYTIEYATDSILILASVENIDHKPHSAYTILLEKSKYNGQSISFIFE